MRLLYGEFKHSQYLDYLEKPYLMLNFSAMLEGGMNLQLLPPNQFGEMSEPDFVMWYTDWIFGDDARFVRFITMIEELTRGTVVYIITGGDAFFMDGIDESFMSIIRKRYGIKPYYVGDAHDFTEIKLGFVNETDFDPYYGIRNYNNDMIRYNDLKEANRIANGGRPYDG